MNIGRVMSNEAHKLRKSCESLLGICAGLIADDSLNDKEVRFLENWLNNNLDIAEVWPGDVVARRVRKVLDDDIITDDELEYLKGSLKELIGSTLQDTGAVGGISTRLPVNDDDVSEIIFQDNSFCFTGKFLYGTRAACERAIEQNGALAIKNIRKDLCYLVIGTMVSSDWANTSHGRKIEQAVEYQRGGCPILIVSEECWVKHLRV